jgi:cytochrome d ubiquinol oxidase subunit II
MENIQNFQILWFVLIFILLMGYALLDGFDLGVGALLPFLAKNKTEKDTLINSIGPVWDGNEVWMIAAGGAMFAAFPNWYATLFSGFYLPLLLILLALIVRAVAFEYRSKDRRPAWRSTWDTLIFVGSFVPALLWGVAFANLIRGVPIDANMNYTGGFWNLLNPYALSGGLATLSLFTLHGATFLSLKTKGELMNRARAMAGRLWLPAVVMVSLFVVLGYFATDMLSNRGALFVIVSVLAAAALLAAGWLIRNRQHGWAFVMTGLTIALAVAMLFLGLYPRVMVSSLDPAYSLTIDNASSTPYTLRVMSIVALIFVPIILLYQGWTYWVFRKRIGREEKLEY